MTLPLNIMIASVSTLAQVMNDRNAHQSEIYKAQVQERIASMQFALRRMELVNEQHRIHAQKEILQSLITAAQHVFDRKMDFFHEAYHRSHSLIEQHQHALIDEQRLLNDKLYDEMTDSDALRLNKRISEITSTLIELKQLSAILTLNFNYNVSSLRLDIDHQKLLK